MRGIFVNGIINHRDRVGILPEVLNVICEDQR